MSGGSSPSGTTQTVQKADPWSGQQPFLTDVFGQAQGLDQNYTPQYFPGSTVAPFAPQQTQAINAATSLASNDPTANAATGTSGAYLSGSMIGANPENAMLSPYSSGAMLNANPENSFLSPFLNGEMASAGNPYFQQTADSVLSNVVPNLEAQFNQGNSLNNPGVARAVSEGSSSALAPYAFSNYQQGLSNALTAAQQVGQNYDVGQGNQLTALSQIGQNYSNDYANQIKTLALAPQTQSLGFNDISQLNNAGAESQAQSQADINDAIARFNFQQQLPYQKIQAYENAVQGSYGGTSTLTQPYFQNQAANALGGGLGGAALGGIIGGPYGAAVGGGAGLLYSLFS